MFTDQPDAGNPSTEASPLRLLWAVSGWKLTLTRKETMEHNLSTYCTDESRLLIGDFHSCLLEDCQLFSFNNKKELLWEKSIILFLINLPNSFPSSYSSQLYSSLHPWYHFPYVWLGTPFLVCEARRMWFLLWCTSREITNGPIQKI